jgi:hypothetical protein
MSLPTILFKVIKSTRLYSLNYTPVGNYSATRLGFGCLDNSLVQNLQDRCGIMGQKYCLNIRMTELQRFTIVAGGEGAEAYI